METSAHKGTRNTRSAGRRGEDRAVDYLIENGYTVIARNYQTRSGEIDCIVESPEKTLVFVEVKSSRNGSCGHPLTWITRAKQRKLIHMATRYLAEHDRWGTPARFDVVALTSEGIEHLQNAFLVS